MSWSYLLLTVQVHTTTHCRVYREQLGPASPKADPAEKAINKLFYNKVFSIVKADFI
jgi:hypothetical protein